MDPRNIPPHISNILRRNDLTMNQKMFAFFCFMPKNKLPEGDLTKYNENLELGNKLKQLIQDGKITDISVNESFEIVVK